MASPGFPDVFWEGDLFGDMRPAVRTAAAAAGRVEAEVRHAAPGDIRLMTVGPGHECDVTCAIGVDPHERLTVPTTAE